MANTPKKTMGIPPESFLELQDLSKTSWLEKRLKEGNGMFVVKYPNSNRFIAVVPERLISSRLYMHFNRTENHSRDLDDMTKTIGILNSALTRRVDIITRQNLGKAHHFTFMPLENATKLKLSFLQKAPPVEVPLGDIQKTRRENFPQSDLVLAKMLGANVAEVFCVPELSKLLRVGKAKEIRNGENIYMIVDRENNLKTVFVPYDFIKEEMGSLISTEEMMAHSGLTTNSMKNCEVYKPVLIKADAKPAFVNIPMNCLGEWGFTDEELKPLIAKLQGIPVTRPPSKVIATTEPATPELGAPTEP